MTDFWWGVIWVLGIFSILCCFIGTYDDEIERKRLTKEDRE